MTRDEAYEPGSDPTSGGASSPGPGATDLGTVRRLDASDHADIIDLWRAAGLRSIRPEGRDSPAAMEAQLRAGRLVLLGLERDGRLIGMVMVTHDGRKGWINRLAVRPEHRRRGLGRSLIRAAERHLDEAGLSVVCVLIERDNEPSLRLFEEAGYRLGDGVIYLSKRADDSA